MKKTLIGFCLAAVLAAVSFAGSDDVIVLFSTPGPDTYADHSPVLDGECYALVWTPTGETFAGIGSDGVAKGGSKVLLKAPVAKGGRCPCVQFTVDGAYYEANGLSNGTMAVYLLDTRRYKTDADGVITSEVASWGRDSTLVNGYGATGGSVSGRFASTSASSAAATDSAAAVPEGGQNLRIRDIQLIEGNVYIYASGTLPSMRYELKAGGEPADLEADGKERYGKGGAEDLIIVKPQTPGAQFFSISTK